MDDVLKDLIKQFIPFAQKHIGFARPPRLFLKKDNENAKKALGKTAYYDPNNKSVYLYVSNRHPKDILRSLGHELVHHKQHCDGMFDGSEYLGPGYAQKDPLMRKAEEEANQKGSMCLRDFEDMLKAKNETIYYEHLHKGDKKMSLKDWKEKEIGTLLSEAWGFKFNSLQEFEEFDGKGELQAESEEEVTEEAVEEATEETVEESADAEELEEAADTEETVEESTDAEELEENKAFAPNHYCVHHGGVSRNGSVEIAEAVSHNFNEELGKVTHYDMKFDDGSIMEGVPFEDIQVTNASLAEGHGSHSVAKRDDDEDKDELDEKRGRGRAADARNVRGPVHPAAKMTEEEIREVLKKAIQIVQENSNSSKKD
jgi:hypothetical protein